MRSVVFDVRNVLNLNALPVRTDRAETELTPQSARVGRGEPSGPEHARGGSVREGGTPGRVDARFSPGRYPRETEKLETWRPHYGWDLSTQTPYFLAVSGLSGVFASFGPR